MNVNERFEAEAALRRALRATLAAGHVPLLLIAASPGGKPDPNVSIIPLDQKTPPEHAMGLLEEIVDAYRRDGCSVRKPRG